MYRLHIRPLNLNAYFFDFFLFRNKIFKRLKLTLQSNMKLQVFKSSVKVLNKLKYQFCVILMSRLSIIAVKILEKQSLHVIVQLQSYVQTIYLYTKNMAETSSDICIPYVLESDKILFILIRFVLLNMVGSNNYNKFTSDSV